MTFWWKLGIATSILALYTFGVWHVHTWYDGYKTKNIAVAEAKQAEQGQNDIIKFNQQLRKTNAKDPCLNTNIPIDTLKLLK